MADNNTAASTATKKTARKSAAKKTTARKPAAKKATARKSTALKSASRTSANGSTAKKSIEIVARKVTAAGGKARSLAGSAADRVDAGTRQAVKYLRENPKVAASIAAGLVTVGSALLARKLQNKRLPGKAQEAANRLSQAVHNLIK